MPEWSQDRVEHHVEFLAYVFCKKPEHEIPVLLKQLVFPPVAAVSDRVGKMLGAIQFHGYSCVDAVMTILASDGRGQSKRKVSLTTASRTMAT